MRREERQLTVLHLVQPVDGGVARVVTDLVRAQAGSGLRPVVACPPGSPLALGAASAGAEVHDWSATRAPGPRLAGEVAAARRIVRASRPHVVHAHSAKAGLAGRIAVRGRVPTVFQPHAWSFEAVGGRTAGLALGWERFGARWADHILCVSESERRTGQEAGIAARWSVIHNGIDLDRFRPGGRAEARASLPLGDGVDRDAPLVVCVGRLTRQKGQDVLLRAWRRMPVAGARLVLVGDGPDRGALEASAPPGVLFTGACADVRPWIHAADVLVLPSRWEGMALAPLEAMACGRPVVMTDVNGARESLPPGHEDHCLVPPEDPAALAAALTALLADPELREAVSHRALRHTRAAFDVRRTAGAVAGLYQELVGMSGPTTRKRTER
ncbi:glycosyltransferase [Streptomyces sp. ATCC51928]|uniref:Glycosyltransferase n=1 Tax=Streptomyces caviscabies TaxID=90079 RepID=A0ABW2MP76_9ACTN|nr:MULTISPECIES: glycosyltransferase [unclassified Streptomyces]MDX3505799.1 glycosyltransferase [Streptomyces sp. ATCC51928]MDX5522149.1 glycosyltransferase [Streptomyces sp. DE06-01C]